MRSLLWLGTLCLVLCCSLVPSACALRIQRSSHAAAEGAMLPGAGQSCGPPPATGTCIAEAACTPARGSIVRGHCAGSNYCCVPAAGRAAPSPAGPRKAITWIGDSHTGGEMGKAVLASLRGAHNFRQFGCGGSSPDWWSNARAYRPVSAPGTAIQVPPVLSRKCGNFPCCPHYSDVLPASLPQQDLIVIEMAGTNLLPSTDADARRQTQSAVDAIRGKSRSCLFIGAPPLQYRASRPWSTPANVARKVALVREIAIAAGCAFLDSRTLANGQPLVYSGGDGMHFAVSSGRQWADTVVRKINAVLAAAAN